MTICNTFQMIEQLAADRNMKFKRIGDEYFVVSASPTGGIVVTIGDMVRPFQVLNYTIGEYWTEVL